MRLKNPTPCPPVTGSGPMPRGSIFSGALPAVCPAPDTLFIQWMGGVSLAFRSSRAAHMPTLLTNSPAETEALGETWGRTAVAGQVIFLSGDLGAGKTQLVKGIARGLGVTSRVHSPTFTLVNEYAGGRLRLFHLDWYRLETRDQIIGAGLAEYLSPEGVAVIEWAERWFAEGAPHGANLPALWNAAPIRRVSLEVLSETGRRITYEDSGV